MDQQQLILESSRQHSVLETLLLVSVLVLVLLSIYYIYQLGNKKVEEEKRLRVGPNQLKLFFFLGLVVLGIVLLINIFPVISSLIAPFIIAAVLAYAFNPLVNRLKKLGLSRFWATVVIFLFAFGILLTVIIVFIPMIAKEGSQLISELPALGTNLYDNVSTWYENHIGHLSFAPDTFREIFDEIGINTDALTQWAKGAAADAFSRLGGILSSLVNVVTVPVLMFYFMKDAEEIKSFFTRMIFPRHRPYVLPLARDVEGVLGSFIRGQLLVALSVVIMASIGLLIVGVPYWIIFGIIAGFADLIPYVGPIIGALPPIIFTLATDPSKAIWVAVVFVIAQQLESSVVSPKIVGESVGLHPAMIIFVLLLGGALFGFVGLLTAVPLAGIILVIISYINRWFRRNYPQWFNKRHS